MPVYVNHTHITGLRKLMGVGKAVAREIIKKHQQVGGKLKPDDIKAIVRILAATWQQWFDRGEIIFDSPPQPRPSHQSQSPGPDEDAVSRTTFITPFCNNTP